MLEVTKKQAVKTRKVHECFACCEAIEKGEAAVSVRGKEDDERVSFHLHTECHQKVCKLKLFETGLETGALKNLEAVPDVKPAADVEFPF